MELIINQLENLGPLALASGKAAIVLILGWIVAGWVGRFVRRRVNAMPEIDQTLGNFAASVVRWVILLMVLVAIMGIFGIEATSLVAMMGAATLAIGLALQGTLSDLAAGFMLILFRPYKIGQYVDVGGTSGTVVDLNLFVTELVTPDNIQIIVPNGQAWGAIITNYSAHDNRRVDLVFGIDYGDEAEKAKDVILAVATADDRVLNDPEPWVRVTNLGDSSVDITARLWCKTDDYWELKFAMTQAVKEAFDQAGISIPYPHTVMVQS
ncbi:mechanosensitive ion channel domain-containing protein [Shimia sp.]|uniref:mechanosensitive ion channel family protein n=1 Tax=Shimia sp. TaxID=1954381 RepID=UPI0032997796